jgi:hypothetical protein
VRFLFLLLFPFLQAADLPELSPDRIVSAASRTGGKISPGEIIVLYSANAGPAVLAAPPSPAAAREVLNTAS